MFSLQTKDGWYVKATGVHLPTGERSSFCLISYIVVRFDSLLFMLTSLSPLRVCQRATGSSIQRGVLLAGPQRGVLLPQQARRQRGHRDPFLSEMPICIE